MRQLNREVETLRKLLRRNRQTSRLQDVVEAARREMVPCLNRISFFLRELSFHQTENEELAHTVQALARRDFFRLVEESEDGPVLRRLAAKATLQLLPANVWLYLHVQETLAELGTGNELAASLAPEEGSRMNQLRRNREPDPILAKVAATGCPLKGICKQPRPDHKGDLAMVSHQTPTTLCQRVCEMLFLEQLGFVYRETAIVLGLGKSTIDERIEDCRKKERELRKAANPSETGPVVAQKKEARTHG